MIFIFNQPIIPGNVLPSLPNSIGCHIFALPIDFGRGCMIQSVHKHCLRHNLNSMQSILTITIESFPQKSPKEEFYYYTGIQAVFQFYKCKQTIDVESQCKFCLIRL